MLSAKVKVHNIFVLLTDNGMVRDDTIVRPVEASETDLLKVHTASYIKSLRVSNYITCKKIL